MADVPITGLSCPYCGYVGDRAMTTEKGVDRPKPGHYIVCMRCGQVGRVTPEMSLRALTLAEIAVLPARIVLISKALNEFYRMHNLHGHD